ncbi:MAG: glycosyltransferase family 9 protein [Deltaproteobacteria bacterium]|jgi:ADP-heptose:LPS heptosyltransferase|nr:glycosyltransferase family 9 protein [Deltaproteobacteria bacterium]
MQRHLIIQLARIGDLIQSKRLVLSLHREGEVHIVLDKALEALGRLVFPYAVLHVVRAHAGSGLRVPETPGALLAENAGAFAELAAVDFTSVYNLNQSPLSLSITSMFDPERVVGYRLESGQPVSSRWCKMAWRWTRERKTAPLNLADFWAFFHPDPVSPAEVNPAARAKNPAGKGQRLGFVLSGRAARRSLPPEYLARYIEALFTARKGPEVLLLGGAGEQQTARRVCKFLKPALLQRLEDLSGKTSLADLHGIIASLDLLFTPDTGAMHLAAHLGTPVMACFLSSAWVWETGPYGLGHEILQAALPCVPCLESAPCPHKTACLAPFAAPDKPGVPPHPEMTQLFSSLDDLGATFRLVSGRPESGLEEERGAKRLLVSEYLKISAGNPDRQGQTPPSGKIAESVVNKLLVEQDWMLPDYF